MPSKNLCILLRPAPDAPDRFLWCSLGDAGRAYPPACDTPQAIAAALAAAEKCDFVLATPARDTALRQLECAPKEQRHIRESTPYLLEESLAESIGELHFATGRIDAGTVGVAIISRALLQGWLHALGEAGIGPTLCLPEQQLLQRPPDGWACHFDGQQLVVHAQRNMGIACDAQTGALLLATLAMQAPAETIVLTTAEEEMQEAALSCLPESLRELCTVHSAAPWRDIDALRADTECIDLMQGDFGRRIPWADIWLQWRAAALLVVGALLLQGAAAYTQYRGLDAENERMRLAARRSYQQMLPDAGLSIEAARARLQEELESRRRTGNRISHFSELIVNAGNALHTVDTARFLSVNYDVKEERMRTEIEVPEFQDIKRIRDAMQQRGISSRLLNSSAKNNRIRARLLCRLGEGAIDTQEQQRL